MNYAFILKIVSSAESLGMDTAFCMTKAINILVRMGTKVDCI
jgi:hypothetical protein